ncbi:MAG: MFS transporter [Candidatus Wallbacteria bacterium]|nr:MFS transporter [Candidatus Wallbacteria bacterium]
MHPTVIAVGLVSFFTDLSSEIIYPLLPLFLTGPLAAGAAFVGLVEGIAESTASLLKLWSGRLSDRLGHRKALIVAGYGLSSCARPAISLAAAPVHVLLLRFVDRIGKGVRTAPRDALIAAVTPREELGRAYGFHRGMDHLGAVLGPLVAALLLGPAGLSLRTVFALAAVPAALAMAVAIFGVADAAKPEPPAAAPAHALPSTPAAEKPLTASFKWLLVAVVVFALANSSDAFLLLRATHLGVPSEQVPLLWSLLHVIKSALAMPAGRLADRLGKRRLIAGGWVLYALVYAALAAASAAWHVWLLFAVYGVFFALTEGAERALVAELAPGGRAGSAFGLYHLSIGIAALPASLLAGVLWDQFGAAWALGLGAALALTALIPLALSGRTRELDAAKATC